MATKKLEIPVPGLPRPVGLGQVIKKATAAVGIRPCGGCRRRARVLNGKIVFLPRRRTRA